MPQAILHLGQRYGRRGIPAMSGKTFLDQGFIFSRQWLCIQFQCTADEKLTLFNSQGWQFAENIRKAHNGMITLISLLSGKMTYCTASTSASSLSQFAPFWSSTMRR